MSSTIMCCSRMSPYNIVWRFVGLMGLVHRNSTGFVLKSVKRKAPRTALPDSNFFDARNNSLKFVSRAKAHLKLSKFVRGVYLAFRVRATVKEHNAVASGHAGLRLAKFL